MTTNPTQTTKSWAKEEDPIQSKTASWTWPTPCRHVYPLEAEAESVDDSYLVQPPLSKTESFSLLDGYEISRISSDLHCFIANARSNRQVPVNKKKKSFWNRHVAAFWRPRGAAW